MKNEQNQNGKQPIKDNNSSQGQGKNQTDNSSAHLNNDSNNDSVRNQSPQGQQQKSNIAVDNEGKIGKAHDQWDSNNDSQNKQQPAGQQQGNNRNQVNNNNNDKGTTPDTDTPVYDAEKTEKKIPTMESNKNSK